MSKLFRSISSLKKHRPNAPNAADVMAKLQNMPEDQFRRFFKMSPERAMDLPLSVVIGDTRWRQLWGERHARPASETFHAFLVAMTRGILGEDWWKHQEASSSPHAVVQWAGEWYRATRDPSRATGSELSETGHAHTRFMPNGPITALLTLGYDLYCTQSIRKLPSQMLERMRRMSGFQSVRYEVACAAIMMRAGFLIEFLDDHEHEDDKHCEFLATRRKDGTVIGIEAKSRERPGVLNVPGEFDYDRALTDSAGLQRLLRKAKKQGPANLPFITFVDVNQPPSPPGTAAESWPWAVAMNTAVAEHHRRLLSADPFTVIAFTNVGHHFGTPDQPTAPVEGVLIPSLNRRVALPDQEDCLRDIGRAFVTYAQIPREV